MRYRWATPDDGRRFLGWMVAAIIGGALEWRPHLLLTAPAAQGKTWLLKNVLERLMGPMLTSISDATPAAIAKVTQYASLPIAIDEAEPSDEWVLELLKTLRAASSDFGSRIRVAPNGGVNFQQARFCALLGGHGCAGIGEGGRYAVVAGELRPSGGGLAGSAAGNQRGDAASGRRAVPDHPAGGGDCGRCRTG